MIAEQFDGLQMGVEQRGPGRIGIDEHRPTAAFQRAAGLAQAAPEIAPVMSREPGGHKVERRVLEGKSLGGRLDRLDVAQALLARRRRHRRQHLARQIRGYDPARVARQGIGNVAAAGPEIEREPRTQRARNRLDRFEVGSVSVNRAFDVGPRSRTELRFDDLLMRLNHQSAPSPPEALRRNLNWYKIECYPIMLTAMLDTDQRRLLGEFVRAHRELAQPSAPSGRRRTPGLRREELAGRAGISATWCTWIEQGRPVQASPEALGRIAQALALSRAERAYLFELAGRLDPEAPGGSIADAPASLVAAVKAIEHPAYGLDRLWNACCWNEAAARLFHGWLDGECQRNLLRYVFLEPSARALIPMWKDRARRLLAEFRADFAHSFRDARVTGFVETLRGESPFFAEAWDEQAVQIREGGLRTFNHPQDGLLRFTQHTFAPSERPDYKLVMHTPAPDG